VKLDHLFALTDHNAVLQHAKFSVPARREGYTVDDNARALVFAARAQSLWPSRRLLGMQRKLIAFLLLMQSQDGRFHNLMDFSQRIVDEATVGDHLGRVLWATGTLIRTDSAEGIKASARLIFDRALPWARASTSPRTKAYACLGLAERLRVDSKDGNLITNLREQTENLLELYSGNRASDWEWFENILSYDNARLSQALLAAYQGLGEKRYLDAAGQTLEFLSNVTTIDEIHVPIGNRGWYSRGGKRALYDQQPIDVGAMTETISLAYKQTRSEQYEKTLRQALGWFLGQNTKSVEVYESGTGACCDGITPEGLNQNQGSESTISFLLAAETIIESMAQ
jgi:hypothetical protein